MLDAVLVNLRCPICEQRLTAQGGALRCPDGHSFDVARQGYVDLTAGRVTHAGDSPEMVAARDRLLGAGHLDFIGDGIGTVLSPYPTGMVVEVGAGTGRHLARVLDAGPGLVGLAADVSKPALRRAARAHPRMAAVRADVWRGLPIADGSVTAVLDVFAPRSGAEFARILAPEGVLVVVTPAPEHLAELVGPLGLLAVDPAKDERLSAALEPWFVRGEVIAQTRQLTLTASEVAALVGMGPSAHHVDAASVTAGRTGPMCVTAATKLSVWRPRADRAGGS